MRTGEVVADLASLDGLMRIDGLATLVERKRTGAEAMKLAPGEVAEHEKRLDALGEQLHDAHARSALPEEPTTTAALEDLVVRLRLASGGESVAL